MQVFHGIIRLQGSLSNEVSKRGMTVPEIYALQRIHGRDAVVKLEHAGTTFIDEHDERARLKELYENGLAALSDDQRTSIDRMFGEYAPLPSELKGFDGPFSDKRATLEEFQEPAPHSDFEEDEKLKGKTKKKVAAKAVPAGKQKLADAIM